MTNNEEKDAIGRPPRQKMNGGKILNKTFKPLPSTKRSAANKEKNDERITKTRKAKTNLERSAKYLVKNRMSFAKNEMSFAKNGMSVTRKRMSLLVAGNRLMVVGTRRKSPMKAL